MTLPQVANYRHVDIELREALTIKYMKRVQELLTGRVVGKEDEATLLKVFLPNFLLTIFLTFFILFFTHFCPLFLPFVLLKVVRLEANISRAMLEPAEEREEKEVKQVDSTWLQNNLAFMDWKVFMEETIGEEVEVVVSNLAYLDATSRLLNQMLEEAEGRKIVQQYLVSSELFITLCKA